MPGYVALLRAVNLGRHQRAGSEQLRTLGESVGLEHVQTLLASGNLIGRGPEGPTSSLERRLEEGVRKRLGFETSIVVRTASEWRALLAENPLRQVAVADPAHLLAVVLKSAPAPAEWESLARAVRGREVVRPGRRVAYVHYVDGVGTSRLTSAVIERALGTAGTARNWNTVRKIDELLGKIPA